MFRRGAFVEVLNGLVRGGEQSEGCDLRGETLKAITLICNAQSDHLSQVVSPVLSRFVCTWHAGWPQRWPLFGGLSAIFEFVTSA